MQTTMIHDAASAACAELAPLLGSDPIPVGVATDQAGGVHIAVVAILVRVRDMARVRTATGVAEDEAGAVRSAVLEALRDHAVLEQALERLVDEGAIDAAVVRWGDRPLTFAGDADVDLRLIALFDLTLADTLHPGARLALCTDRFAYRLLGGRPAVALAAQPGAPAAGLDRLTHLVSELLATAQPATLDADLPAPDEMAAAIASALGEEVRWLQVEHGGQRVETGPDDPCSGAA